MALDVAEKKDYDLTGKLLEKYDVVQRGSFSSREFVVEKSFDINGKTIINYIKFQCTGDRTGIIDRINAGDVIKVHFNIRGNRWEKDGKVSFFTNLDAWRIEQSLAPSQSTDAQPGNDFLEPLDTFTSTSEEAIDDLPF